MLLLLPLSVFRRVRVFAGSTIWFSSYVFGLIAWMFSFVITYGLWGLFGVLVGMMLAGVGVVPLAMIAAALNGYWLVVVEVLVLALITYGARLAGLGIWAAATARK